MSLVDTTGPAGQAQSYEDLREAMLRNPQWVVEILGREPSRFAAAFANKFSADFNRLMFGEPSLPQWVCDERPVYMADDQQIFFPEYVPSDSSDSESDDDISSELYMWSCEQPDFGPAAPGMKWIRKGSGGKSIPMQVPVDSPVTDANNSVPEQHGVDTEYEQTENELIEDVSENELIEDMSENESIEDVSETDDGYTENESTEATSDTDEYCTDDEPTKLTPAKKSRDQDLPESNSDREFINFPAPAQLIAESRTQPETKKWRLFEEDFAIGHMLTIRDEAQITGENRFREVSRRLQAVNGISRTWTAVKNFWNRTGRARSGFDERKCKKAPLATSQQGKKSPSGQKKAQSTRDSRKTKASTSPAATSSSPLSPKRAHATLEDDAGGSTGRERSCKRNRPSPPDPEDIDSDADDDDNYENPQRQSTHRAAQRTRQQSVPRLSHGRSIATYIEDDPSTRAWQAGVRDRSKMRAPQYR